jgi:transposase, IS6 family
MCGLQAADTIVIGASVRHNGNSVHDMLRYRASALQDVYTFKALLANPGNSIPRVINMDKNRAYPSAVDELKKDGTLRRRCKLRQCK